jgi:hypothetical protein
MSEHDGAAATFRSAGKDSDAKGAWSGGGPFGQEGPVEYLTGIHAQGRRGRRRSAGRREWDNRGMDTGRIEPERLVAIVEAVTDAVWERLRGGVGTTAGR